MVELVEFIVKSLVENKEEVKISSAKNGDEVVISVVVAEDDLGRVIGKNGRIAQSIRTIVKSMATREKLKYFVKIGDK